ncbi:hypothetical protein GOODEAATRI_005628 [Goodea atripinnis]|uniref:3-ketoacyl-[acyl-carrier-protein] reductase beta subunit n=1 Tax=Goodea atripinnis TaxID=208336 RepID=A0ABV0PBK5_9TELE
MFPYTPRKEDELELRKGEMFLVLERCQDGWFKGTSMHTGNIGVFPGNYMSPVSRTASGSNQPKVPMSLCTQAGRGVTIVSPSSAPLGAVVPGPDFNKPLPVCSTAVSGCSQPAAVTSPQTATGQQPKVPLHVSSQMTVNQARNAVRTAACHSQDRPTAAVTPIQSVTYFPHSAICSQSSTNPAQGCSRVGVAMGCAAASLTPPNVSAASLDGDALRPVGNNTALNSSSNTALTCRLDKDVKSQSPPIGGAVLSTAALPLLLLHGSPAPLFYHSNMMHVPSYVRGTDVKLQFHCIVPVVQGGGILSPTKRGRAGTEGGRHCVCSQEEGGRLRLQSGRVAVHVVIVSMMSRSDRAMSRLAVVCGGSRGIGQAVSRLLGERGCRVAVVSRNQDTAQAAVAALDGANHKAFSCDVSKEQQVQETFETIQKTCGNISYLVNAAGINRWAAQ